MTLSFIYKDHGEALEFELMSRGFDLRRVDDESSDFTLRQLWILYDHLPFKNEVNRSILGMDQFEYSTMWESSTALLADIFDSIQYNTFILASANTDSKSPKPKAPKPYPRPSYGKKEEKARKINPLEGMPTIRVSKAP